MTLIKYFLLFFFTTIFLSCGSIKPLDKINSSNDTKFIFENNDFAVIINGVGTYHVYNGRISIKILSGLVKLNHKYENKNNYSRILVGLGQYYEEKKWKLVKSSKYHRLSKKIITQSDLVDITNMEFEIPYKNLSDIKDTWIVLKILDDTGKWAAFSFDLNKNPDFNLKE